MRREGSSASFGDEERSSGVDETDDAAEGGMPEELLEEEILAGLRLKLDAGETRETRALPPELQNLDEQLKLQELKHKRKYARQDIALRRRYAWTLLAILAVQIAVADTVFCVFAGVGRDWRLSDGLMQAWLAATVVEIVGVVTVVTRHLFPRRDQARTGSGPGP